MKLFEKRYSIISILKLIGLIGLPAIIIFYLLHIRGLINLNYNRPTKNQFIKYATLALGEIRPASTWSLINYHESRSGIYVILSNTTSGAQEAHVSWPHDHDTMLIVIEPNPYGQNYYLFELSGGKVNCINLAPVPAPGPVGPENPVTPSPATGTDSTPGPAPDAGGKK